MTPEIQWIDRTPELAASLADLGPGPLALDTEADSYHRYHDKVCLVQLSFDGRDILVDPLAGVELGCLESTLEDGGIRKILHGADYDLRILRRDFGLSFRGLFDTMVAARLVGERAFGLASLVESHLGVRLDKTHQLADWSQRPLPDDLVHYAASDTRHLAALAERLEARLVELGRVEWAAEEFRRLEKVRWTPEAPDEDAFRRVKRSGSLDPRGLAVLRELYLWRDARARERDVPPFRIVGDKVLIEMARNPPAGPGDLGRVPGIPGRLRRASTAREILGAVSRALAMEPRDWPESRRGTFRRASTTTKRMFAELQSRRDVLSRELDLDPSVIASRAILEAIVARVEAGEGWTEVENLREWQARLVADAVEAL